MAGYRLTPSARGDLSDIWDYTCERWAAEQAERYTEQLRKACARLAEDPRRGHAIDDIRSRYRSYSAGSHSIVFTVADQGIEIVRFLHQSMDIARHL